MDSAVDRAVANMDDTTALPRKNGELVFEAPWEGRIFALAVALHERGRYPWDAFRSRLIAEIAAAEARGDPASYYERWLRAFEALVLDHGLIGAQSLDARTAEFASGAREDVF